LDQVSYTTANWGGSDFATGGYSLEVPNPDFLCVSSTLLKPSNNVLRGTPGIQNSIFDPNPKVNSPKLESVYFMDSLQIWVAFSELVLPDFGPENLVFSPSLEIDSVVFATEKQMRIILSSPAVVNQPYTLTLSDVKDCLGNPLVEHVVTFVLAEDPLSGELIINELLFNPRTGEPKFVEIKNSSEKYLRLEDWAIANLDDSGDLDQVKVFGKAGLILEPGGYLAITTNSAALQSAYPRSASENFLQISSLPTYPISGGTVALISPKMEIVEYFSYDEDLHHPLLRDSKGVSLERLSSQTSASHHSNWQSASGNEGFATPGRKNSQAISGEFVADLIRVEPEVFDPEGSSGPAFTTISYQLDQTGWVGTFAIYSVGGQLIQTLSQNQILGTTGLFTWSGTDSTGRLVRAGYYVLMVELYEPNGKTNLVKKTLVVATRL
jgi:hypothetical protein